jgi:integrase
MEKRRFKHGCYTKQPLDWKAVIDHIRMNILNPELQLFAATALIAAPRVGEIIELKVRDVTGEYILIEKTKCRIRHGRKVDPYRQVVKPEWYAKMVEAYLPILNRKGPGSYLFQKSTSKKGGKLTRQGANYRVGLIFKGADIDLGGQLPTMHTFRKTCADFLYEQSGKDLAFVQQHLAHRSIANTAKYLDSSFKNYAERAKQYMT